MPMQPHRRLHAVVTAGAVIIAAILAIITGGDAFALAIASGATTGIGYWLGGMAHRYRGK
jgi:hypothetical protein